MESRSGWVFVIFPSEVERVDADRLSTRLMRTDHMSTVFSFFLVRHLKRQTKGFTAKFKQPHCKKSNSIYYKFMTVISSVSSYDMQSCLNYCKAILCRSDALWEVVLLSSDCSKAQTWEAWCHASVSGRRGNISDHEEGWYVVSTGGKCSINGMREGASSGLSVSCWVRWCLFLYDDMLWGVSETCKKVEAIHPILFWGC